MNPLMERSAIVDPDDHRAIAPRVRSTLHPRPKSIARMRRCQLVHVVNLATRRPFARDIGTVIRSDPRFGDRHG